MLVKCEAYAKSGKLIGNGLASSEDNVTIQLSYFVYEETMSVRIIEKVDIHLFDFNKTKLECRVMMMKEDGYVARKIRRIFDNEEDEEAERAKELKPEKPNNFRDDVRMDVDLHTYLISENEQKNVIIRDLSSGGVRFSTTDEIPEGEYFKIIVPYKEPPLTARIKTIRKLGVGYGYLYGCKFVDLPEQEEAHIRSWIFAIQAERRKNQIR